MPSLAEFLMGHDPQTHEEGRWGEMRFHLASYLCVRLPPLELITSARAVLLRAGQVMVVRDPGSVHVLPGGRRQVGESLEQTLRPPATRSASKAASSPATAPRTPTASACRPSSVRSRATSMPSTVIRYPSDGQVIAANTTFTIRTRTVNLQTGFFSDPAREHYLFPQTVTSTGTIQGHSRVVVQRIGDPDAPLDPRAVAFFKALTDVADGNGELTAVVEDGLPAGSYRLCAEPVSFSGLPVVRPVELAGVAGDCVHFTVRSA